LPTIPAAAEGNINWFYIVNVAGTTEIDAIASWAVGDWIISNGTKWEKIPSTQLVTAVAGKTGNVALAITDIVGLYTSLQNKASSVHLHNISSINSLQTTLDLKEVKTAKGTALGYCGLDSDGLIQLANIPLLKAGDFTDEPLFQFKYDSETIVPQLEYGEPAFNVLNHRFYIGGGTLPAESNTMFYNSDDIDGFLADKSDDGHEHVMTDITDLAAALSAALALKAATDHGHEIADIDELATTISGINSSISGKSDTGHGHEIADIDQLATELLGFAVKVHTHTYDEVGDLTVDLAAKQNTDEKGAASGYCGLDANSLVPLANLPGKFEIIPASIWSANIVLPTMINMNDTSAMKKGTVLAYQQSGTWRYGCVDEISTNQHVLIIGYPLTTGTGVLQALSIADPSMVRSRTFMFFGLFADDNHAVSETTGLFYDRLNMKLHLQWFEPKANLLLARVNCRTADATVDPTLQIAKSADNSSYSNMLTAAIAVSETSANSGATLQTLNHGDYVEMSIAGTGTGDAEDLVVTIVYVLEE
jgi:hypothetical protein